jgi:hypothetical protein
MAVEIRVTWRIVTPDSIGQPLSIPWAIQGEPEVRPEPKPPTAVRERVLPVGSSVVAPGLGLLIPA